LNGLQQNSLINAPINNIVNQQHNVNNANNLGNYGVNKSDQSPLLTNQSLVSPMSGQNALNSLNKDKLNQGNNIDPIKNQAFQDSFPSINKQQINDKQKKIDPKFGFAGLLLEDEFEKLNAEYAEIPDLSAAKSGMDGGLTETLDNNATGNSEVKHQDFSSTNLKKSRKKRKLLK